MFEFIINDDTINTFSPSSSVKSLSWGVVATDYTLSDGDKILFDTTGGDILVSLPLGEFTTVSCAVEGGNSVTFDLNGHTTTDPFVQGVMVIGGLQFDISYSATLGIFRSR